jgi:hypothetical protein
MLCHNSITLYGSGTWLGTKFLRNKNVKDTENTNETFVIITSMYNFGAFPLVLRENCSCSELLKFNTEESFLQHVNITVNTKWFN